MLRPRVIPCLLLHQGGLVKTRRFRDPTYVGDPVNAIRIFNEKEVDELVVLDIDASREGREPDYALVEHIAGECFMPLCYGGGIRTVEQADRLFSMGVEKVSLQTAALRDMDLIGSIASRFGSQSVIFSLDLRRDWFGRARVFSACERRRTRARWQDTLVDAVKAGAGEVMLNVVNRDGTMSGMDLDLVREASALVSVPLVAMGGIGSTADIEAGFQAGASAVGAGSFFVFHGPNRAVLITYPRPDEPIFTPKATSEAA